MLDKIKNLDKGYKWLLGLAIVIPSVIALGYSEKVTTVYGCVSTYSRYVLAQYYKTNLGLNPDGTTRTYIESWTEPASDVYLVKTVNGELESTSHDFDVIMIGSYYAPKEMPIHDTGMRHEYGFSRFIKKNVGNLTISTQSEEDGIDNFSEEIGKTSSCIDRIDRPTIIKTWYSISYGSNF